MGAAFDRFAAVVRHLAPTTAVVLGSGLGGVTSAFRESAAIPFGDIPGLVPPTVHGHGGRLAVGLWGETPAMVFFGRLHFYEGHSPEVVTGTVRAAAELGAKALVLTNAAGGIHPDLNPGSLMALRGHVKLVGGEGWRGLPSTSSPSPAPRSAACPLPVKARGEGSDGEPGASATGEESSLAPLRGEGGCDSLRGGGCSGPYSPRLLRVLRDHEAASGRALPVGVYAALTGPCYETPAEIRALAACGVDAVGMSTAMEAEAAAELGLEVAAISCITNKAAGLSAGPLDHTEVLVNARLAVERLAMLIAALLAATVSPSVPRP